MTRMMRSWRKANAYVRSAQHAKAAHWPTRTLEILDGDQAFRRRALRSLLLPHEAGLMRTSGEGLRDLASMRMLKIARSGSIVARFYSRAVPRRKRLKSSP